MRLTDEELRALFARAEEIERAVERDDRWIAEREAVIGAGQEVGLSRQAVEMALSERLSRSPVRPEVGSRVWARSADGKFYLAEVLEVLEEEAQVRFLRGSDHRLRLEDLRPGVFLPGERIGVHWPMWGPWTCTVVAYDATKGRVKLSDGWGSTRTFAVSEVWLAPPGDLISSRRRMHTILLAGGAALGGVIGSLLTVLLMR
jgi:hypothetical protein